MSYVKCENIAMVTGIFQVTHTKKATVFLFKIINLVTKYSVYNFPPFIFPFTISAKTDLSQKGLNKHFRPALL